MASTPSIPDTKARIHLELSDPSRPARPRRVVAHLDLDSFFVAVERVLDPRLEGQPVIVGGNPDGRGVVASASYEARAFGIHNAMPAAQARRLCPRAIFVRGHHEIYRRASRAVGQVLEAFTPKIEWASIDEAYLDLTGTERLLGPPLGVAQKIRQTIEDRLRLSASLGLASNKLVAKIASTRAKPRGVLHILEEHEAAFLAPMEVGALPGIGPRMAERLRFLGVRTLGELRRLDPQALEAVFGSLGPWLVARAAGRDPSPVARDTDPRSVSRETTFSEDSNDRAFLEEMLFRLCGEVGSRMRTKGVRGRTVTLKLRYADFTTITRSVTRREATHLDPEIYAAALKLLESALGRRTRVRLLGVGLSNLEIHARQLGLFEAPSRRRREAVTQQVDAVRSRFGYEAVTPARCLDREET